MLLINICMRSEAYRNIPVLVSNICACAVAPHVQHGPLLPPPPPPPQGAGEPGGTAARLHGRGLGPGREQRARLAARLHRVDHLDQHADCHHHVRQLGHHRLRLVRVHGGRLQFAPALRLEDAARRAGDGAGDGPHLDSDYSTSSLASARQNSESGHTVQLVDFLLLACCAYWCCNV